MRCPNCGNEVGQDEAFCGHCGTPVAPQAHATEMVYTPPRSGQLNLPSSPSAPNNYHTGRLPEPTPTGYNPNMAPAQGGPIDPHQSAIRSGGQQQTGFYQDATEAMSVLPANPGQGFQSGYNPQSFAGAPMQGSYPGNGQYGPQMPPFQAGNYTQHGYPQAPQFPTGQNYGGYGVQPQMTPPPQQEKRLTGLIIASIFLVIALIGAITFGSLYLLHGQNAPNAAIMPSPVPTLAPTATPSPTPSPTATPIPSPTVMPTPAPDANFSWCNSACTSNGYIVEYPMGWNQGQTSDKTGVLFLNPGQPDQYAAFKVPTTQGSSNASDLVDADLQNNFASKQNYKAPNTKAVTTIGGETWTYATATYDLNNQKEKVQVFATVHLGKNYVIELQAANDAFDAVNTQYFSIMIGRFQFQQATS